MRLDRGWTVIFRRTEVAVYTESDESNHQVPEK